MLAVSKSRQSIYDRVPEQIYELGADVPLLLALSKFINLETNETLTSYERVIYDNLVIILNANDTAANKLWYIQQYVNGLYPLQ